MHQNLLHRSPHWNTSLSVESIRIFLIALVTYGDAQPGRYLVRLINPMDTIHFIKVATSTCFVATSVAFLHSLDLSQFHSLCTEFVLPESTSIGFPCVAFSPRPDPSPLRDCAVVVNEMPDLSSYTQVKKDGLKELCLCNSHCACVVLCLW